MPHDPKSLQTILTAAAPPDAEIQCKPMFGGIMAYAGGVVFASMSDVGLALKFAGPGHAEMIAAGGAALRYEPEAPASKSYVVVPSDMLDDAAALRGWITRSIAGLKPAKPRR